ncbi:MAG: hypothetical protein E4H31_02050, partial [Dehalococcoidia bacterium]
MINDLGAVIAAYFIGAFPHLLILGKLHHIEPVGDLHMALWQKKGPAWGLAASGIDVIKGIGTVLLARFLGFDIG